VRLYFLICLLFLCSQVWAQADTLSVETEDFDAANDTSYVDARSFGEATIDRLKADPDLNYQQPPTVAESLWDRIKYWLAVFFERLIEGATMSGIGRILMYTIGLIILVVLVLTLLKVNAFRVLYAGADRNTINHQVFHENIHEMDFEKLIREANEKGDFRQGTRLVLLYALKLLSDQHLITWEAGKTNHDYVAELSVHELKAGLNEISFYFDYAWYGNFTVTAEAFGKVQSTFQDWRRKLKS
jgi:hypothetical protein